MILTIPVLSVLSDAIFLALLGWCCATDLQKRQIPNATIFLMLGLATAHMVGSIYLGSPWYGYPLGMLFGVPFFFAWTRGQIGGGDVKLLFVMGLYLGVAPMLIALMTPLVFGAGLLLWRALRRRPARVRLPLAPALLLGALTAVVLSYLF